MNTWRCLTMMVSEMWQNKGHAFHVDHDGKPGSGLASITIHQCVSTDETQPCPDFESLTTMGTTNHGENAKRDVALREGRINHQDAYTTPLGRSKITRIIRTDLLWACQRSMRLGVPNEIRSSILEGDSIQVRHSVGPSRKIRRPLAAAWDKYTIGCLALA